MTIWIDAQPPPALATWLRDTFQLDALPVRDIGLRDSSDESIFAAARAAHAIVMTKVADFVRLLNAQGTPPHVLWITCGNTSNARLRATLARTLPSAIELLENGEPLVEISEP